MSQRVRTCSFNVRLDTSEDGDDAWPNRRDLVAETIAGVDPDVIGLQEPLPHQLGYLDAELDRYDWYGVPRRGTGDGESSAVGWRADRFDPIACETRWLSESPHEPTVGWDASTYRTATSVRLRNRDTGIPVALWNVHLDHEGSQARREGCRLLSEWIDADGPAVLVGDFNAIPESEPIAILTGESGAGLSDGRAVAESVRGPEGTFHGFDGEPSERIDYVFVTPDVEVERYETVAANDDGRYPSDHFPVVADLVVDAE